MVDEEPVSSLDPNLYRNRTIWDWQMRVLTSKAQGATENLQISLYSQLLSVTQIKTNHAKPDSTRSFCPQPGS